MSGPQVRGRLHGFDAVRGLAAVAVVALHAAYPYALAPLPGLVWPVPLDEPSRLVNDGFWCIEGFVMPLFFTISGYFLAQSLSRRSPGKVAAGRTRRLLVSFWTVGIVILTIDLMVFTLGFVATGQATWRDWRRMKFGPAIDDHLWGPAHLWYLEYLWVLCTAVCLAAWGWNAALRQAGPLILFSPRWSRRLDRLETPNAAVCVAGLGLCALGVLSLHPEIVLGFQHHFLIPAGPKLVHGGLFLLLGVVLYRVPGAVDGIRRAAPWTLAAAAAAFAALMPRIREAAGSGRIEGSDLALGALLTIYAGTSVLGFLGAGFRWLDRPIPRLDRLAAASFWIYVAHHPLCALLQLAARPVPVSPVMKFAAVTAITLWACLFSYRRFVADRSIGRMLDGDWPWEAFRRPTPVTPPQPIPVRRAA